MTVIGTSESADDELADVDLCGPTMLVIGNETDGMSAAWESGCDRLVKIPMAGSASSLNAAASASIALYKARRQRRSSCS